MTFIRMHAGACPESSRLGLAFVAGLLAAALSACGGGSELQDTGQDAGGDSVPAESNLVLAESNAKAAMRNALVAVSSPVVSSAVILATPKRHPGADAAAPALISETALALARQVRPAGEAKAAVDETVACQGGGTLQVTGQRASTDLSAGDDLQMIATDCKLGLLVGEGVVNGQIGFKVTSGTTGGAFPRKAEIAFALTGFRLQVATRVLTGSGDLLASLVIAAEDAPLKAVFTGRSLAMVIAEGQREVAITWKDFLYAPDFADDTLSSFKARIETQDPGLGSGIHTYVITRDGAQGLRVQGRQSGLSLVQSGAALVLALDADGDGSYEKTIDADVQVDELLAGG